MKKIGIVTYYSFYNYGSILQAYSLQSTIKEFGLKPILIDYADHTKKWNRKLYLKMMINRIGCIILHPYIIKNFLKGKRIGNKSISSHSAVLKNKFTSFVSNEFEVPFSDYTKDDEYKYFVTGSDQVWQLNAPGLHPTFFLRFCDPSKRISYAASFGTTTVPKYNMNRLKKYLKDFYSISVRERIGIDIVRSVLGESKAVSKVLDPVLLHNMEWWNDFSKGSKYSSDNILLCYFLGESKPFVDIISEISSQYNLKVVWISTGYEKIGSGQILTEPSPKEFVNLVANANIVITDSLHGMEFCVLFHKRFIPCNRVYENNHEQKNRIDSFLQDVGLSGYLVNNKNNEYRFPSDKEYQRIDVYFEQERKKSLQYLDNLLK